MGKEPARYAVLAALVGAALFHGCSSDDPGSSSSSSSSGSGPGGGTSGGPGGTSGGPGSGGSPDGGGPGGPPTNPDDGPPAGNSAGGCAVPPEAQAESIASPRTVVGDGSAASCTSKKFVDAVAAGGVITFNCGAAPVTITVDETAWVYNDKGPVVIDGGGKVALSGQNQRRILQSNACDPAHGGYSKGVTGDCNEQVTPKLSLQNITFVDGAVRMRDPQNKDWQDLAGGGAVWIRGGRTKIVNARFFHNSCDDLASDAGGGAVRILDFPKGGSLNRPVYVVNSTFGGKTGYGNSCANGGALSSIGTSWAIYNSVFTDSHANGMGANDGEGGNGGAIYNDGNLITNNVCGTLMNDNHANEGGSAIFFVSNDDSGTISITDSTLRNNPKGKFQTSPGLYVKAKGPVTVTRSVIE